jgi:hypothetical protein
MTESSKAPNATVPSEVVHPRNKAALDGLAVLASTGSCRWKYHCAVTPANENLMNRKERSLGTESMQMSNLQKCHLWMLISSDAVHR